MPALIASWGTTVGLLAAIGAQNAFVIESAILRRHILWVALTCILSDFVMITIGLLGLSQLIKTHQDIQMWLAWIGIGFLLYYGLIKIRDGFKDQSLERMQKQTMSVKKSVFKTLAFSWLNPHVYLDTVILIPALAMQHKDENQIWAALGGYAGVVTWFIGISVLGLGSARFFQDKRSWKALNFLTAAIMFWVAAHLYFDL